MRFRILGPRRFIFMSLYIRLNLVIALTMTLIVGLGIGFTIYLARESVRAELASSVQLALRSVKAEFQDSSLERNAKAYRRSLENFREKSRHLRFGMVLPSGEYLDLSSDPEPRVVSVAPAWFSWWIRPEIKVEELMIRVPEGALRILIQADPNDEISEAWSEAKALFGLLVLQALLVGLFVQVTLSRALRPLPVVLDGLEAIENGDFNTRLPRFPVPEFERISRAFNHTALALEKARQENRALTGRLLSLQEDERKRLARELHDQFGQSLTGIKVTAGSLAGKHAEFGNELDSILEICDQLFLSMRTMMRRLRPTVLDELGLGAALEVLIAYWRELNPQTEVTLYVEAVIESCSDQVGIQLFRIVQEALNNVARHANAGHVEIRLDRVGAIPGQSTPAQDATAREEIQLSIRDDGRGFNPARVDRGFGLLGMRERAETLGGHLTIRPAFPRGLILIAKIPHSEPCR